MNNGQLYRVYWNRTAAAAYSSLYFFIFLSLQFSNIKIFVTFFSGTVRPRRLNLGTHLNNGQVYGVYQNQAAAAYLSLYFSFSPIFKHWNFSSHFSPELWGLEDWNLVDTLTVGRCIVCTGIRLLLLIFSLYFFHFSFSPIFKLKNVSSHFSPELWGLDGWNLLHMWKMSGCIVYTRIKLLLLFIPLFFHFSFSPIFKY